MAIALRATGSFSSGDTGNITPGIPAGTAADDILLAVMSLNDVQGVTTSSSGWTIVKDVSVGSSSGFALAWKRAVGGDAAPSFVPNGAGTFARCGIIVGFSGAVNTGDPWDVAPTHQTASSSSTATAPSITTTSANNKIVMLVGHRRDANNAALSAWACATDPTTLTERADNNTNAGLGAGVGAAEATRTTAGSTGNGTATIAATVANCGFLVALVETHLTPDDSIDMRVFDLPSNQTYRKGKATKGTKRDRREYFGWQQSPLSADAPPESDQEVINRRLVDVPLGRDRNSYSGYQSSPLPDNNEEAFSRIILDNPEVKSLRPLTDFTWTFVVTPDDVEDPPIQREILSNDYLWTLDKNSYDGVQAGPLSEDLTEEAFARYSYDLAPWIQELNSFDGWLQQPLADDNEESAFRRVLENPEIRSVRPLPDFTVIQAPLAESIEDFQSLPIVELTPSIKDRNTYDGFAQSPLSDDFVEPYVPFVVSDIPPWARDRHSYEGYLQGPRPYDTATCDPEFSGTALLSNYTVDERDALGHAVTLVGDAHVADGALILDGAGDQATLADAPEWTPSADHTIEVWITPNVLSGFQEIIAHGPTGANSGYGWFMVLNGTTIRHNFSTDGTTATLSPLEGGTLTVGRKVHIAISRVGDTRYIHLQGIKVAEGAMTAAPFNSSGGIGIGGAVLFPSFFNGSIHAIRVKTSGARYGASDFNPPDEPFPEGSCEPVLVLEDGRAVPLSRTLYNYEGFQQGALPEESIEEQPVIEGQIPIGVDRHSYDGYLAAPLSDDAVNEELSPIFEGSIPAGVDRNSYDGFLASPLSADSEDESVARRTFEVPFAADRHSYDGFVAPPLSADFVVDTNLQSHMFFELAPAGIDRFSYDGLFLQPLSDDAPTGVENVYNLATTGIGL